MKTIDLLIVDDSPVARMLLEHMFSADPEIRVIGAVNSGVEAINFIARRKPHVISMDMHMPNMNGFETTRRIMATTPIPIVIVSASYESSMISKAFEAIQLGALAIFEKPYGVNHPDYAQMAKEIVTTVKLMSEIKLVRRLHQSAGLKEKDKTLPLAIDEFSSREIEIIAIGASTGGPQALESVLSGLPKDFSIPLVIVQHIALGFLQGMADWLNLTSGPVVSVARQGEQLLAGHAYIAPNGFQMGVTPTPTISLTTSLGKTSFCPSVAYLFQSVAKTFGSKAIGLLLTGMGADGAEDLKLMQKKGAITVAQDEASSVVYGMPAEAVKLKAADYVLPPKTIAQLLLKFNRAAAHQKDT